MKVEQKEDTYPAPIRAISPTKTWKCTLWLLSEDILKNKNKIK